MEKQKKHFVLQVFASDIDAEAIETDAGQFIPTVSAPM